jgi:hypothetical protein
VITSQTPADETRPDSTVSSHRLLSSRWLPVVAVLLSTVPISGMYTLSRMFYVRDLSIAFRPRFQFIRRSIYQGTFPLWDPYPAHGQSAINDALYQLFHLPSLLIRVLLPELLAYNMWIALPVPLAAAGMYLFLRRHVGRAAAAMGAFAFAVSGPVISSPNFPNLSWSIATVPFVFWALERLFERRTAVAATLLAAMVATQALAGEPVSLFTTLVIAFCYAVLPPERRRDWRLGLLTAVGLGAGSLLSAIQYVPLAHASSLSARGADLDTTFWTFHPLAMLELFVPHFFGDYFSSNLQQLSWMLALNSHRDPFYYTMYVGVPIVLLAATAMLSMRPGTRFWTITSAACALASVGSHTPFYPVLQAIVPPLRLFRFPVKYLTFTAFGLAILAAMALQRFFDDDIPRPAVRRVVIGTAVVAALTYVGIAWVLVAPALPIRAFFRLAVWADVPAPIQGAEFLLYRARPLFSSLLLKLICGAFLLWAAASGRRERRLALAVFCGFIVVDLIASNSDVNPTMDPELLRPPAWVEQLPPGMHERVYIGGRLEGFVNTADEDAPKFATDLDGLSTMEQRHVVVNQFLFQPSGAGVRESMSYDLPMLWPLEFAKTISLFHISSKAARYRFLSRVGVRYALLPQPPYPGAKPLAEMLATTQMHLYELDPKARRVTVVPDALLGPSVPWQIQGLFLERFDPATGVLVSENPPPPSGRPGKPAPPSAAFVDDGINRVVVSAGLPQDGYLALFDSYDPDWHVDVDGTAAPLMRANGIFRAVHLTAGSHVVTFTYRPSRMYIGAAISGATALALAAWCLLSRRRV